MVLSSQFYSVVVGAVVVKWAPQSTRKLILCPPNEFIVIGFRCFVCRRPCYVSSRRRPGQSRLQTWWCSVELWFSLAERCTPPALEGGSGLLLDLLTCSGGARVSCYSLEHSHYYIGKPTVANNYDDNDDKVVVRTCFRIMYGDTLDKLQTLWNGKIRGGSVS